MMSTERTLAAAVLTCAITLSLAPAAAAQAEEPKGQQAQPRQGQPQQTQPQQTPVPTDVQRVTPQEAVPLRVMVGKSLLVTTADRLRRVSVTDPAVADAMVVTPTQVLVHGRAPGEVTLVLWDEGERSRSFDLRVDVDSTAAAEEMKRIFPNEAIQVSSSRNAIVLSGHVSSEETAQRAAMVAGAYSRNVVNVLSFGPQGAQTILLEVKFAEVDRSAISQWGLNIFSTGAGNTFGALSTQQFGGFSGSRIGAVPADVQAGTLPPGSHTTTGAINNQLFHQPGVFGTNDLLNFFLFRSDLNLGLILRALQQKNILQILAEPNLIAVNGRPASFLAGGEFPYPVVQGAGGLQSVTIQFKEFGVRLSFTPRIMPNGNIHLAVRPEVSALDFGNALTISGFLVPAVSTRRAETEFELQDGQSFVIAGLLDNRMTNVMSKVPGLGDIPILGNLFRSKNLQRSKTELMVLVTARLVSPTNQPSPMPEFPERFLEEESPEKGTGGEATGALQGNKAQPAKPAKGAPQ